MCESVVAPLKKLVAENGGAFVPAWRLAKVMGKHEDTVLARLRDCAARGLVKMVKASAMKKGWLPVEAIGDEQASGAAVTKGKPRAKRPRKAK